MPHIAITMIPGRDRETKKELALKVPEDQEETILTVKTTSGETYGFYGNLNVINNGADGRAAGTGTGGLACRL